MCIIVHCSRRWDMADTLCALKNWTLFGWDTIRSTCWGRHWCGTRFPRICVCFGRYTTGRWIWGWPPISPDSLKMCLPGGIPIIRGLWRKRKYGWRCWKELRKRMIIFRPKAKLLHPVLYATSTGHVPAWSWCCVFMAYLSSIWHTCVR